MSYILRHMENRILELSKSSAAILLKGPRQAGKTTILRSLAEKENKGRNTFPLTILPRVIWRKTILHFFYKYTSRPS